MFGGMSFNMNLYKVINLIGSVLILISLFMVSGVGVSLYYHEADLIPLTEADLITFVTGLSLYLLTIGHRHEKMNHRDVFLGVTLSWVAISLFGSLPYVLSGATDTFTNAFFESVAGFTTTGSTVVRDIEILPHGVLFWRHLTQWIGGMGIILFTLAILPFIGSESKQLFKAEVPEITVDRLKPTIINTAKVLWFIYMGWTVLCFVLYRAGGMSYYDALCHALTTMATGGFSTKNASLGYFNSLYIESVAMAFMLLAGINYSLFFYALRGAPGRFLESSELKFYMGVTLLASVLIMVAESGGSESMTNSLRYSAFQAISIVTTTGYSTYDYERWGSFSQLVLMGLLFFGGMIGSTSGGIKQIRMLIMLKQINREMFQLIHPRAVTTLKIDGKPYTKEMLGSIWGFLFLFLGICVVGTLILTWMGVDYITASSTVVSATSNVGPALGTAGPAENYYSLPEAAKWVLAFCMLTGRLELYTVLILFIPKFWQM
jgi:trk system potassium uptake protein TrkH